MTKVLVFQHISCEPPGIFEDVLVARGAAITRVELDEGEPIPPLPGFDALVVMGGPMGAYEEVVHPWIDGELASIAEALDRRMPVLGVCLGAQLLACAAGGKAYAGHAPEVGVLPVRLLAAAADDHLFGPLPATIQALQWHGDTFDLPPQAVLLASSDEYPNQVFRAGTAYGIQFHVEVTSSIAQQWAEVPEYAAALDSVRGPGSLPGLLAELEVARQSMQRTAETVGHRFADLAAAQ